MGVSSTEPTSRRGYLSQSELAQFADISITDTTEANDQISQAEELVDSYVGYQDKFMCEPVSGRMAAVSSSTFTLQSNQQNSWDVDYFKLCEVEILGGTGAGQRRKITGSTKAGVLTLDTSWTVTPDTTSFYKIYQLGKFPRKCDVVAYSEQSPTTYYKQIPEQVKRAVAAQVAYIIEMGADFFSGDKTDYQSEQIGDYSYTKGAGSNSERLVSPRAKNYLAGIYKRTGQLIP